MKNIFDETRNSILFSEKDGCEDEVKFVSYEDGLLIDIDNPWEGDTESGFGRSASVTMEKSDIPELIKFLQHIVNN